MAQDQQNAPSGLDGGGSVSALHRKTASGRAEHQARAMTLARALRLSVAKVADDAFDMAMATLSVRTQDVAGPDLLALFDDKSLLLLLDGPQRSRAAVVIDPTLVGALIQQQTMGQVLPDNGGDGRAMTSTDAALCAPFLDAVLERAAGLPEAETDRQLVSGYRFGAMAEDARLLHMAMEAPLYHVIRMNLDVAQGSRQGEMILCMPVPDLSTAPQDVDANGSTEEKEQPATPLHSLAQTVPALQIELSLVLSRLKLPLRGVGALKVGDTLSLADASFDKLEIRSSQGRKVGTGTLGQLDGYRAVRIAHKHQAADQPRRRSDDREGLDQPALNVIGSLQPAATFSEEPATTAPVPPTHDAYGAQSDADATTLPDLPDMSDIPDFDDLVLPDIAQG